MILPWVLFSALVIGVVGPALAEELTATGMAQLLTETWVDKDGDPRGLKMFVYVPESIQPSPQPRPLVVALHGCAMSAEDYFVATGWGQLAQEWNFALLLPQVEEPVSFFHFLGGRGNPARCFNWWDTNGTINLEVSLIMRMIKKTLDDNPNLDPSRIYVTGVSAGGSMTVHLLAVYPTCFAAGGSIAGVPYYCSKNSFQANQGINVCMQPDPERVDRPRQSIDEGGRDLSAQEWGDFVRKRCKDCPSNEKGWPPITIWQGAQDRMVGPGNMRDLRRQWTNLHGIDEDADNLPDTRLVPPYVIEHKEYSDRNGRVLVETWLIAESDDGELPAEGRATDHGVVIDPEEPTFRCGRTQAFVYDGNICSTLEIARFFDLQDRSTNAERAHGRCAALR